MAGISQNHHRACVRDLNMLTILAFTSSECVGEQGAIWKNIVRVLAAWRATTISSLWQLTGVAPAEAGDGECDRTDPGQEHISTPHCATAA